MQWMNDLDKEYNLTNNDYGMGDFYEDLKEKGYIDENKQKLILNRHCNPITEASYRRV